MLDDAQRDRLVRLFADGAELPSSERAAFVNEACADDPALRQELAELLAVEALGSAGFLAEPVVAPALDEVMSSASTGADATAVRPLPEIDGYTAFERLAEGGMGAVYKAQQLRPVRREVAIKLIRSGMASDDVIARFEAERQALALMSHPYIAAVYDAGTDATGRPFLAMEFVDGVPITDYCEREKLSLEDRLRLFVKVCRAVDHAHRRGVLHRDIKPSNVLVARVGEEALPKVIDFGIAKALEGPLGDRSIHTLEGTFLGTPDYMAPEQIEGDVHRIDTRSDVYALGVLLYELLTSRRPIEMAGVLASNFVQWSRAVRDVVPRKPSTRLRELVASRVDRKAVRGEREGWIRRLAGDLDWVVMKALEKEPDRRYGSARELAADLESFLQHAPVSAGPPSGFYVLRRLARRYRVQVAAGALVLLSLVLGLTGTLWFLVESRASEDAAVERAREAEGVRIAAEAALVAQEDPNLALLLALEASALTDDTAVRRTVYDALPQHCLVQRLDGHDEGIEQGAGPLLRYLSDGRLIGSGASDAVLWDPESGAQLRRFVGPRQGILAMAIDPTERFLLAATREGRAYLWVIETGELLSVVGDPPQALVSCSFSPDGSRFATSSLDGTARVFATDGAREPLVLQHGVPVGAVAFDEDGTSIVTFAKDGRTRRWNLLSGVLERTYEPRFDGAGLPDLPSSVGSSELLLAPDIDRIVSAYDRKLWIHTTDGELVAVVAAWLPRRCGDRMLANLIDGFGFVDLRTGAIERHDALRLRFATPSPDGRRAVALDSKNDLCLLDLTTLQVVRYYHAPAELNQRPPIAFHPDGTRFAVQGVDIRIWSFEPEWMPFEVPDAGLCDGGAGPAWGARSVAVFVQRGAGARGGSWVVWDIAARRRLCEVHRPGMDFLAASPCGTKLIGALPEDGAVGWRVVVFDLEGRVLREIQLRSSPQPEPSARSFLGWATDDAGRFLVTALKSEKANPAPRPGVMLQCHDLDTGELLSQIPHPGGEPTWVGGSEGELVALAGLQLRTLEVVDRRTGSVRARVSRPPDGMHIDAAVSPDGRYLLGTLGEPLAFVWDLHAGVDDLGQHPLVTYTGLATSGHYPCGFLDEGRLAWVTCNDEIHVFEATTGRVFAVLRLSEPCIGIAESPDGSQFVAQSNTAVVQRFPTDPIATARRLAVGRLGQKELALFRIGTPSERIAAERAWLSANETPGNHAELGRLALADGDLDEAIACYQRGADLGVLGPYYDYLYLELVGLYGRRLGAGAGSEEQSVADCGAALTALERAFSCGVTRDRVLALPGIEPLLALPRFVELLGP